MSNGITVDLTQFNLAMTEYVAFTRYDLAYALNRAMKNIAFKAIGFVKMGSRDDILSLFGSPKFFAWFLRRRAERHGFQGFQQRHSSVYQERVITRGKRAGQIKRIRSGSAIDKGYGKFYTVPFAREYAESFVRGRASRLGFLKSFYLRLAKALQASIPGGGQRGGARDIPAIVPGIQLATPNSLIVDVSAVYSYKRDQKDSSQAEKILETVLPFAVNAQIADMRDYVEKGMSKRAAQISARGAAVGRMLAG